MGPKLRTDSSRCFSPFISAIVNAPQREDAFSSFLAILADTIRMIPFILCIHVKPNSHPCSSFPVDTHPIPTQNTAIMGRLRHTHTGR